MTKRLRDKRRQAMRTRGYSDGIAGRPAQFADAEYQRSWRRGQEARGSIRPTFAMTRLDERD